MRLDSGCHAPDTCSLMVTLAGSVVTPSPRRLARSQAGERTSLKRRPPSVASRVTRGGTSGSAWSERSRLAALRSPGTSP